MEKKRFVFLLVVATYTQALLHADRATAQIQRFAKHDTSYFVDYPHLITTRFYFSQKYTSFDLAEPASGTALHYRPNTTLNNKPLSIILILLFCVS